MGRPTTDIDAALAAIPVQRRVSLAAVLLAIATLRLAEVVRKPVALLVTKVVVSPENPAPTPTNRFTPVRSIVSRSAELPPMLAVPRFSTKLPPASTYPPRFSRTRPLTTSKVPLRSASNGLVVPSITGAQLIAVAEVLEAEVPAAALYFTLRFFTSTVNSEGKPTTDIDAALAAMPVQRRVSLASVLLAMATLRSAEVARKPVAEVVMMLESAASVAPTPTNKFTPVRSIVSRSMETVPLSPNTTPLCVILPRVNAPAAST